jgi:hypothetical protein
VIFVFGYTVPFAAPVRPVRWQSMTLCILLCPSNSRTFNLAPNLTNSGVVTRNLQGHAKKAAEQSHRHWWLRAFGTAVCIDHGTHRLTHCTLLSCDLQCVKPKRDLPIGIVGCVFVATALYVLMSAVLVLMVPYQVCPDSACPARWECGHLAFLME